MQLSTANYWELCFLGCAYAFLIVAIVLQRRHLQAMPEIQNPQQLKDFKIFVRVQMYLAVAFLAAAGPAILLIFFERTDRLNLSTIVLSLPYFIVGLTGYFAKRREAAIRDPARCAQPLREEFGEICFIWKKKILPGF